MMFLMSLNVLVARDTEFRKKTEEQETLIMFSISIEPLTGLLGSLLKQIFYD